MRTVLYVTIIQRRSADDIKFWGLDPAILRERVVAHCRMNWESALPGEPIPDNEDEIVTAYFHEHDKEWLVEEAFPFELPAAAEVCDVLQRAFVADPGAIKHLFGTTAVANKELQGHPTIPYYQASDEDAPTVSLIGILNGCLAVLGGGQICSCHDDKTGELLGFQPVGKKIRLKFTCAEDPEAAFIVEGMSLSYTLEALRVCVAEMYSPETNVTVDADGASRVPEILNDLMGKEGRYVYTDMACPEDNFTIEVVREA